MAAPPKWAQDLALDAAVWWESKGNRVTTFALQWHRHQRRNSSGTWHLVGSRIILHGGRNRLDAKLVLLHELAHVLTTTVDKDHGWDHSPTFWDTAWSLYRWAKLPMKYCKLREFTYRKEAKASYARVLAQARTANPE